MQRHSITAVVLLALALPLLHGNPAAAQPTAGTNRSVAVGQTAPDYAWVQEEVGTSDAPLRATLQRLERETRVKDGTANTRETLAERVAKNPNDRAARIGWSYAAYLRFARRPGNAKRAEIQQELNRAAALLRATPIQGNAEAYRVRFLVESAARPTPALLPAGKRLLAADRDDTSVRAEYAFLLGALTDRVEDTDSAILMLDALIQADSQNPGYLASKAMVLWTRARLLKKQAPADEAILLYEKASSLFADNEAKAMCQRLIRRLRAYRETLAP